MSDFPLRRGAACLVCRRRKTVRYLALQLFVSHVLQKCDAEMPCGSCVRAGKANECEYQDTRFLVHIHGLESEVVALQQRIQELETRPSDPLTTESSNAFMHSSPSSTDQGASTASIPTCCSPVLAADPDAELSGLPGRLSPIAAHFL